MLFVIVAIISCLILAYVVGCVARDQGRSFGDYFLISLFLSPIIGLIILAIKGKPTLGET